MAFKESAVIIGWPDELVILRKARGCLLRGGLFFSAGTVSDYPADDTHSAQSFFNGK